MLTTGMIIRRLGGLGRTLYDPLELARLWWALQNKSVTVNTLSLGSAGGDIRCAAKAPQARKVESVAGPRPKSHHVMSCVVLTERILRDLSMEEASREFQLTLTYTPALVRRAAFAFVRRGMGKLALLGLAILFINAAPLSFSLRYRWLGGMWFGAATVLLILIVLVYFMHYRRGMARLRRMKMPHSTILLIAATFMLTADSGSWSVPWRTFTELWQFREFWLLLTSPNQYITLPMEGLSDDENIYRFPP
jgi:hypothetical protein